MSNQYEKIIEIISYAGGQLIGRTRLQKIFYILTAANLEDRFNFEYHYYGPYSEDLAQAALEARALGLINEKYHNTSWGASYSEYSIGNERLLTTKDSQKQSIVSIAAEANSIELELAATALYLYKHGEKQNPWGATKRLKPQKADQIRLENAKNLYGKIVSVASGLPMLPEMEAF